MKNQQFTVIAHTYGIAMEIESEIVCEGADIQTAKHSALGSIHADAVLGSVNNGRFYSMRHDDRRNAESVFVADGYVLEYSEDSDEVAESLGWDLRIGYLNLAHDGHTVIFAPECDENADRIEFAAIVDHCNARLDEALDAGDDDFHIEEDDLLELFK